MATWPLRGQQAPQFWDQQLRDYIDETDEANTADIEAVTETVVAMGAAVGPVIDTVTTGRLSNDILLGQMEAVANNEMREKDNAVTALDYLHARLNKASTGAVRAMMLGSSTAFGSNASTLSRSVTHRLAQRLQRAYPGGVAAWEPPTLRAQDMAGIKPTLPGVHMMNEAFGALTSANYVQAASVTRATNLQPHIFFHIIGQNDYNAGTNPDTVRNNVKAAMASLDAVVTEPAVHVLMASYAMPATQGPAYAWSAYIDALGEAAASHTRGLLVDASKPFIKALASGPAAPDPMDLISADNVHPNDNGHAVLADEIARVLNVRADSDARPPEVLDRFTRGVLGAGETGHAWAQAGGGVHVPSAGYLTCTTAGNAIVSPGFSDAEVSAVITFGAGSMVGIMAKSSGDAASRLFLGIHPTLGTGSTPALVLYMGATLLASPTLGAAAVAGREYHLRLWAKGDTLVGYLDGVEMARYTLGSTDATNYGLQLNHGVRCNVSTGAKWRNFAVRAI